MRPSDHLFDFGRPVAYYPGLVKHLGSVNAVLLFCQFFYWRGRESSSELGVYKSVEEIEQETGMTYREQATARKHLVERGILIETHKRLEHRIYYRIDIEKLDEVLSSPACGKRISPTAESAIRETTEAQSGKDEKRSSPGDDCVVGVVTKAQFVHTEITSETTPENSDVASAPAGDGFEEAWKAYPKREGANPKNKAHSAWKARLKEGVSPAAMAVGVARYAAYCKAKGSVGTEYVMQAQRFFGKGREFENDWVVAAQKQSRHHGFDERDYYAGLTQREDGTYAF